MSYQPLFLALIPLLTIGACSSQAETDYRGEPLAVVRGKVENPLEITPGGELAAGIAWVTYDEEGLKAVTSPVAVEGSFPGEFTIELYEPPPEEVFEYGPDPEAPLAVIAYGRIVALRAEDVGSKLTWEKVEGISLDAAVAYVRDVPAGSPEAEAVEYEAAYYKFSPEPGFKLMLVERTPAEDWVPCASQGLCVEWAHGSELDSREYELCLEYTDDPQTCRLFEEPEDDAEQAETDACWDAISARDQSLLSSGTTCPPSRYTVDNPQGFTKTVTLTLGAGLADWHFYDP